MTCGNTPPADLRLDSLSRLSRSLGNVNGAPEVVRQVSAAGSCPGRPGRLLILSSMVQLRPG